ncbi:hypothetical protein JZ751_015063 [Albula glossodonta]|uniref:Uncharacterized protein n=1 Tax=Albula glossodonta TaxID=121402 RepID=A0A8T2NTJ1_9TELE|nr:hypothetical protein JZ751_015063 [Albula glossodonta]
MGQDGLTEKKMEGWEPSSLSACTVTVQDESSAYQSRDAIDWLCRGVPPLLPTMEPEEIYSETESHL